MRLLFIHVFQWFRSLFEPWLDPKGAVKIHIFMGGLCPGVSVVIRHEDEQGDLQQVAMYRF